MSFLTDFHERCTFQKSLNATFLSLLPKVIGLDDILKFRPISLGGSVSVHKILAEFLASRLKKVAKKPSAPINMLSHIIVRFWMQI